MDVYDGPTRPSQFEEKEEDKLFIKGVKNAIYSQPLDQTSLRGTFKDISQEISEQKLREQQEFFDTVSTYGHEMHEMAPTKSDWDLFEAKSDVSEDQQRFESAQSDFEAAEGEVR